MEPATHLVVNHMTDQRSALRIAKGEEDLALRLLSALIQGWDGVPVATQGWILRDASLMADGQADAIELPARLLAFINLHKEGRPPTNWLRRWDEGMKPPTERRGLAPPPATIP